MSGSFSYTKEDKDGKTFITLKGTIDEDTILDDVFAYTNDTVVIDLAGIKHINSCGIRTWVNAIEGLSAKHDVQFVNCSVTMIRQFNMISNFGGKGKILSFKIPYYCDACDKEYDVTLTTEEYIQNNPNLGAPEQTCSSCNEPCEFDDLEDKYFHFIKLT